LEANEAATREKDWFGSLYSKSRDAERLLFKEKEAMNLELVDLEQQHQQLLHSEVQSAEELADLREDNESLSVELHANKYIVAAKFFTISSLYLASWPISLLHAHTLRFCRSYRLSPYPALILSGLSLLGCSVGSMTKTSSQACQTKALDKQEAKGRQMRGNKLLYM
jgi:hypothetical protein